MSPARVLWAVGLACCVGLVVCQLTTTEPSSTTNATSPVPTVEGNCSAVNISLCTPCSTGTFYSNETESCFCCSSGSCTNSLNCTPCQEGHYQPQVGQQSCLPCPLGFYTNATSSSACLSCQPGSFANETGASLCKPCAKGYYVSEQNSTACLPCQEGSFCNTDGCSICTSCPSGEEALTEGTVICTSCPPGMFKGSDDDMCRVCEAGEFQTETGKASCDQCPENHYCPSPDINPIQCPSDAFCPAGSTEPQYCMETFFRKDGDTCVVAPLTIALLTIFAVFVVLAIAIVIAKWKQQRGTSVDSSLSPLLRKSRKHTRVYGVICHAETVYAGW